MHLGNYPLYFVKGARRKAAYYTVQVRELLADGWTEEQATEPAASEQLAVVPEQLIAVAPEQSVEIEPEQPVAAVEPEPVTTELEQSDKGLGEMTKAELVAYAEANGVEFKQYATKSEIIEACLAAQNG